MLTATLPTASRLAAPRASAAKRRSPTLENGAELSASEFLRRYEASPGIKAELVDNVVYIMPSPLRIDEHGAPDGLLQTWLGTYAVATPGVQHAVNSTVRLGPDDIPQPDGLLRVRTEAGGCTRVGDDGYLVGAPELVAEVAASSASLDVRRKLNSYRRAGVQEYLVWRTEDGAVDWWELVEDEYRPLTPAGDDGTLRSRVFPGLWLDAAALLAMDGARLLETLQRGLAATPHAEFRELLGQRLDRLDK